MKKNMDKDLYYKARLSCTRHSEIEGTPVFIKWPGNEVWDGTSPTERARIANDNACSLTIAGTRYEDKFGDSIRTTIVGREESSWEYTVYDRINICAAEMVQKFVGTLTQLDCELDELVHVMQEAV